MAPHLAKRIVAARFCAWTRESSQTARPRQWLLFHHGGKSTTRLIIRQLPDRGFKSRPRNQITCRARSRAQTVKPLIGRTAFQSSSVVERSAVNRLVVGSNPTSGANPQAMIEHPGYHVYVLSNSEARLYIGISTDPQIRLAQHNLGGSTWTKGKGPWRILWTSAALSYSEARKLEYKLKRQKGGDGFYKITRLARLPAVNPAAAGS